MDEGAWPVIIIEGQIGAGKTTMGEILERRFGIPLYRELGNPDTLSLLDRFYADKSRWAFTMQIHFLNERFRMIKDIHSAGGGLLDRSIFGDRIFAELLHDDGDMSDEEFRSYNTLLDNMLEHANPPALMVYLDCSVDAAIERISIRNRGLESGIPRDYLEKLNEKYLSWYDHYTYSQKIRVDTESYDINHPESMDGMLREIEERIQDYRSQHAVQKILF
ncbi:MAG: deoxynucleoside kinase [Spirochaetales bacterium]|nr:deoxynucleoside kinase [Spirochaetales bacterium]